MTSRFLIGRRVVKRGHKGHRRGGSRRGRDVAVFSLWKKKRA